MTTSTARSTTGSFRWAREMLEAAGVSQRDLAQAWGVSESSASRWLDGLQATDLPFSRAVAFARLVGCPLNELAMRLGHKLPEGEPPPVLRPTVGPPVPTLTITPSTNKGLFYLLMHYELEPAIIGRMITMLEGVAAKEIRAGDTLLLGNNGNGNGKRKATAQEQRR